MYDQFSGFIQKEGLLKKGDKVLLAVSGGMDSMTMTELFRQSPWSFMMAHCNFQLRGDDAVRDQDFIEKEAQRLQVKCHTKSFDTAAYAARHKLSIQMAARALRYQWLEEVRKKEGCQYIATAHHLDDSIETMLINLIRGTGIAGLQGIPVINGKVIRPLLFATREDIMAFVQKNQIQYREDQSNRQEKYTRNILRHKVLPVMRELNPSLAPTMAAFFARMAATEGVLQESVQETQSLFVRHQDQEIHLLTGPLGRLKFAGVHLFAFLRTYGFSATVCDEIMQSLNAQAGKTFMSDSHVLIQDRDRFILTPANMAAPDNESRQIQDDTTQVSHGGLDFFFQQGPMNSSISIPADPGIFMADYDKLQFPLLLRPWRPGDKMIPLGMKGQKKISDLLIDAKIPLHRKKNIMVLTSGEHIIWVAGLRTDHRYRIRKGTLKYYKVGFKQSASPS